MSSTFSIKRIYSDFLRNSGLPSKVDPDFGAKADGGWGALGDGGL